jgi:hypothetical protein
LRIFFVVKALLIESAFDDMSHMSHTASYTPHPTRSATQELGGRELGVRGCGDGDGGCRFVYGEARTRGSWEEAKMPVRPDSAAVEHEQELDMRAAFMQDIIFSTLMPL